MRSLGKCAAALVLACSLLAAGATAGSEAPAGTGGGSEPSDPLPWLDLTAPDDGIVGGRVPLVEVRGRAGLGARSPVDVVLLFDVSDSTLYPSGMDVDRDGLIGRLGANGTRNAFGELRPYSAWTTDSGDTVLAAEIEAARRLLGRLEVAGTRVGLVSFAGRARELWPVGDVKGASRALADVRPTPDSPGTNLGSGLRSALRLLRRSAREHGPGRRQVVIVLSDGHPTLPPPAIHARSYALSAAEVARANGVRIYGYALGSDPEQAIVLEEMSSLSGGEFVHVQRVGEVVDHLPYADFGGIERVAMSNHSNDAEGRAVRLFGDGSFDGFVPLVAGENLIEVSVRTKQGIELRTLRSIHYDAERHALRTEDDLAQLLRVRTVETELATRVRQAQPLRNRDVRVNIDDGAGDTP